MHLHYYWYKHVNTFENDHLHPEPDDSKKIEFSIFFASFFISKASSTVPQRITLVNTQIHSILSHAGPRCPSLTSITSTIAESVNGTCPQP